MGVGLRRVLRLVGVGELVEGLFGGGAVAVELGGEGLQVDEFDFSH
jgi:hypothetical protein